MLALTAAYALGCLSLIVGRNPVSALAVIPAGIDIHTVLYSEDLGDRNVHGTAFSTVMTGGTLN